MSRQRKLRGIPELFTDGTVSHTLRMPTDQIPLAIDGFDPAATPGVAGRDAAERELRKVLVPTLRELHDRLMAEETRSVLVVLQGLDGSGKSGTIKHVAGSLNPVGLRVASFKEPEGREQREPFLERIRRELPAPGQLTFFDRSYFEDAVVPRAIDEMSDHALDERLEQIETFEAELRKDGVVIVKCFLNLSFDEQRNRFLRRLERPDKHWKFSDSDIETRAKWPQFQAAYGEVIGRTSTETSPWFAVPSDHKWYRNWAVASLLVEHLGAMNLIYPPLDADADAMRQRLTPPH